MKVINTLRIDTVSDLLEIPAHGIHETFRFSTKIETDYIKSIGWKDAPLIIILDLDKIITSKESEILDQKKAS